MSCDKAKKKKEFTSGVISNLQTRVASFLTGDRVPLRLCPTILEEKRPCVREGIINGAKPVFSCGKTSPVLSVFPDIRGLEIGCLRERRGMRSLRPRLRVREDGKEWRPHFLIGLGRTMQEGEQTDDCHLSSQISMVPSSLLPPAHGESYPFLPALFHQPHSS